MRHKRALDLVIAVMSVVCLGVFLSGDRVHAGSVEKIEYGDLTDKEHCIRNYVLSFRDRDPNRLAEVLHEDYIFCTAGGKGEIPREAEVAQTKNMWDALTIFGLEVRPGEWKPVSEFHGKQCDGCWETTRGYLFVCSYPENGAAVRVDTSRFRVVVAPVMEHGATHYKIRAIEDAREAGEPQVIQAPE